MWPISIYKVSDREIGEHAREEVAETTEVPQQHMPVFEWSPLSANLGQGIQMCQHAFIVELTVPWVDVNLAADAEEQGWDVKVCQVEWSTGHRHSQPHPRRHL